MNLIERARQEDKPPFYDQEMGAFIHYYRNPDGPALATEIERLTAQVERMREALEPFARCAGRVHETTEDDRLLDVFTVGSPLTVGDLRRAALSYRGGDCDE